MISIRIIGAIIFVCLFKINVQGQLCNVAVVDKPYINLEELDNSNCGADSARIKAIYYERGSGFQARRVYFFIDETDHAHYFFPADGTSIVSKEKISLDINYDSLYNNYIVVCPLGATDFVDAMVIWVGKDEPIIICSINDTTRKFLISEENTIVFSSQFWINFFDDIEKG